MGRRMGRRTGRRMGRRMGRADRTSHRNAGGRPVSYYHTFRLCDGCMECEEEQPDPQEKDERLIDAEYDRERYKP